MAACKSCVHQLIMQTYHLIEASDYEVITYDLDSCFISSSFIMLIRTVVHLGAPQVEAQVPSLPAHDSMLSHPIYMLTASGALPHSLQARW